MSKKFRSRLVVMLCVLMVVTCAIGCGGGDANAHAAVAAPAEPRLYGGDDSPFVVIYQGSAYFIVCHEDTKVMYVVSDGSYNRGSFTVLVNADGSPMLYEQDE